jgi:hypothetical protein
VPALAAPHALSSTTRVILACMLDIGLVEYGAVSFDQKEDPLSPCATMVGGGPSVLTRCAGFRLTSLWSPTSLGVPCWPS